MDTCIDAPPRSPRLSPEELGLERDIYDALVWIRDALDPGIESVLAPCWLVLDMDRWPAVPAAYHRVCQGRGCGTALCLGGSMSVYMTGLDEMDEIEYNPPGRIEARSLETSDRLRNHPLLQGLFFLYPDGTAATPAAAVSAIDCLLSGETENPWRWGWSDHQSGSVSASVEA